VPARTSQVWSQQVEPSSPQKVFREALPTHLIPWEPLPTPPPPAPPGAVGAAERNAVAAYADRTDTASVTSTASSNDFRQASLSLPDGAHAQVRTTEQVAPLDILDFAQAVDPEEIAEQEAILASIATSQSGMQEPPSADRLAKNIHGGASMDWPSKAGEWGSGATGKAAVAPVTQAWPTSAAVDPWASNPAWPPSVTASDPWASLPEISGKTDGEQNGGLSPTAAGHSPARGASRQALLSQMGMGVSQVRPGRRDGPYLANPLPEVLKQRLEQRESLLG